MNNYIKEIYIQFVFDDSTKYLTSKNVLDLFKIVDPNLKLNDCPFNNNGFINRNKLLKLIKNKTDFLFTYIDNNGKMKIKVVSFNSEYAKFF